MKNYLATMGVDPLAIEAHEKGELEHETIQTISLTRGKVKIVKRSRVNNDVTVELDLNKENVHYLQPSHRPMKQLAKSKDLGHVEIHSSLTTMNGLASVTDIRTLVQEDDKSVMKQELTITNEQTQQSCTTTRYFNPYLETPPHLADESNENRP
jgi:hypothetical protein